MLSLFFDIKRSFFQRFPPQHSRFLFNSITAFCAGNDNRALTLGNAQNGFTLFALKINVCFAVAPLVAAKLKEIQKSVFHFEVTVAFFSAAVKLARKGAHQ